MDFFRDPSSYISIISSSLLIVSEILPFLPCNANGLFDSVFKISPCCMKQREIKEVKEIKEIKPEKTCDEKSMIIERLLYSLLEDIDDLEEKKISYKDMKQNIKEVIHKIEYSKSISV
jgi:hypothetical protein